MATSFMETLGIPQIMELNRVPLERQTPPLLEAGNEEEPLPTAIHDPQLVAVQHGPKEEFSWEKLVRPRVSMVQS